MKTDIGTAPSIILINPKYGQNVGSVLRLASCYGIGQVWYTGDRVADDLAGRDRLPREERMKGYADVQIIRNDYPLRSFPSDVVPIAFEVRENAETLLSFEHPERAVYIFGPEDGSIPKPVLACCHRFVVIPVRHCLNLATAVATVLWDRYSKNPPGLADVLTPGIFETRGLASVDSYTRSTP